MYCHAALVVLATVASAGIHICSAYQPKAKDYSKEELEGEVDRVNLGCGLWVSLQLVGVFFLYLALIATVGSELICSCSPQSLRFNCFGTGVWPGGGQPAGR